MSEALNAFRNWAINNVEKFLWSEGHCYSETLWTGGICDCGALLKDGTLAFIDFKSAKDAYYGHFVQCAGYARQISENGVLTSEGQRLLEPVELGGAVLMVFPFGASDPNPVTVRNAKRWAEVFDAAVTIYKMQQAFEDL